MYAERVKVGNTEYEKLRQVGEIHQNQRNDYRLSVMIPVSVERFNINNFNQPIKGQTLNISGGGMLFAVGEEIGINEKVACNFGKGNIETVEGTVVRSEKTDGDIYRYKISVQFTFKIQQQKQRLQKFVTEQQRLAIKRQLENEKLREGING
jgi:c-di-GMP-binding flagellar brake protein YcgR